MLGKIAKLWAYKRAPKAAYVARHPVKGAKALLAAKGVKGLVTTRAGAMLGAFAALPLGIWASRRLRTES